jgi:tetratricopeptide (TPR) repeat protein
LYDKAISTFQRNRLLYPQSLPASQSAVPLAQAYIAKGPENFGKAENVLLSVLEGNRLVTPEAAEFRESLFELAQLYYRTGRYEEAISRLEEMTNRYPTDDRMPRLVFLMADSYRKSAQLLDARVASASSGGGTASDVAQAAAERRTRLGKAREMYDKSIDLYQAPSTDLDRLYFKLAHFYRADCVYDLGNYEEAIRLYETAAFRFQDDASSLAAYVQIVNAYCALGKIPEAKTANERAKWLLSRMPPDAFKDGSFSIPKDYWEQWLNWTSNSGLW